MSDFDKKFSERLNEEDAFSGMEKNWQSVSKRLDQHKPSGGGVWPKYSPYLWIFAISIGALLCWEMSLMQTKNMALQQQVADLQERATRLETAAKTTAITKPTAENAERTTTPVTTPTIKETTSLVPEHQSEKTALHSENGFKKPQTTVGNATASSIKSEDNITKTPKTVVIAPETTSSKIFSEKSTIVQSMTNTENVKPENELPTIENKNIEQNPNIATLPTPQAVVENIENLTISENAIPPSNQVANAANQQPNVEKVEATVLDPLQTNLANQQATTDNQAPTTNNQAPATNNQAPAINNQAPATPIEEIIKPMKARSKLGIYVGLNGLVGKQLPFDADRNPITGKGVGVEIGLNRHFRATLGMDWTAQSFALMDRKPHFNLPENDPPHNMDQMLEKIAGKVEQRQLSLGLKYLLPLRGGLTPYFQATYAFRTVTPQDIRFEFREHHHGGPGPNPGMDEHTSLSVRTEKKQIGNLFRAGTGLEYQHTRWIFGVGIEYGTDWNKTRKSADELLLKGGLRYRLW